MDSYVNAAVEQFRRVLEQQIARQRRMEAGSSVGAYGKLSANFRIKNSFIILFKNKVEYKNRSYRFLLLFLQ